MMRFKVEHQARRPVMKSNEFAGHGLLKAVNARDTVTNLQHITYGLYLELGFVFPDLFLNGLRDFFGFKH